MARSRTSITAGPARPIRAAARMILAGVLAASALCVSAGRADESGGIRFAKDYRTAMTTAVTDHRNVVLYFGATWCQWCRKMDVSTFADRRVAGLAGQFIWVKIDVDRQNDLTAFYDVNGLPSIVIVDPDGEVIASHGGYMTADQLLSLLRSDPAKSAAGAEVALAKAVARLQAKRTATTMPADANTPVLDVVVAMADAARGTRRKGTAALAKAGPDAWDGLVLCLSDKRLGVRAAAADALANITSADIAFDAFAAPEGRAKQIAQWRQWIAANRDKAPKPPARPTTQPAARPTSKPAPEPAKAKGASQ